MKIGPQIQAYRVQTTSSTAPVKAASKAEHEAKVLKRALDSHEEASTKLLKMLEPKGKNIDIKA